MISRKLRSRGKGTRTLHNLRKEVVRESFLILMHGETSTYGCILSISDMLLYLFICRHGRWGTRGVAVTAAMMCPRLKSLIVLPSYPVLSLQPLLRSVGCSLVTLRLDVKIKFEEVGNAARMMPYLVSLQEFYLVYPSDFSGAWDWTADGRAQMKILISSLPRALRSLWLIKLDGSMIKHLAMFLASGGLRELSDLTLIDMSIKTGEEDIADCLGIAMMSPAGRSLKTLNVHFEDCEDPPDLVRILGLSIENPPNDVLPNLETLIIPDNMNGWNSVAPYLLKGRLPKLTKISRTAPIYFESVCWFQWNVDTIRL